jgi:hypothetical protein
MFAAAASIEADKLAQLALRAATQLDKMERHKPADVQAIEAFVEALVSMSDEGDGVGRNMSLGPITSEMLSEAVFNSTQNRVKNIENLSQEIQKITAEMRRSIEADSAADALGQLKKFTLFIHDFVRKTSDATGHHERGVFDYDYSYSG